VRLVGAQGDQLGIVPLEEAIKLATEADLDLVEVAPQANPPVCKLLDYGKFKYRQKKKRHGQTAHRTKLKQIRIGINTDTHDLDVKAGRVLRFLSEHDKVQIVMRLRGRQRAHGAIALDHMTEFASRFEELAVIESAPRRTSAGQLTMLLKPK
jgi:translation initiation factor IF-3